MSQQTFSVEIEQIEDYRFSVHFAPGDLTTDEPPPRGGGVGPDPAQLLAAAVTNCLMASLVFCLAKARVPGRPLKSRAQGRLERDEAGRLRIAGIDVVLIAPHATPRCLELFQNYCVVTESVRRGVPVAVVVTDEQGQILHSHGDNAP